ncbi:DUF6169 family protein [Spirosoma pomorum]
MSNSSSLSPYPLSETETGFAFKTDLGATYRLDFVSDSDYLPDTPFADSVFSFSLLPVSGSFDRKDPRIEPTVSQTLRLFFEHKPKAVLLYVCSTENDHERARSRLFGQWFSRHQQGYVKFDFNYPEHRLYMSAITREDLPERWLVELTILQAVEQEK